MGVGICRGRLCIISVDDAWNKDVRRQCPSARLGGWVRLMESICLMEWQDQSEHDTVVRRSDGYERNDGGPSEERKQWRIQDLSHMGSELFKHKFQITFYYLELHFF